VAYGAVIPLWIETTVPRRKIRFGRLEDFDLYWRVGIAFGLVDD